MNLALMNFGHVNTLYILIQISTAKQQRQLKPLIYETLHEVSKKYYLLVEKNSDCGKS